MKVKLESFLRELSEKTTENDQYPVLTSSKAGLYLQSDYFNKQVASKDNTGYKIIRRGQFTYRAMSDTGEFFPNMLECADIGIVSPAYPVFEITQPEIIIPEFLKYFFKSDSFQYSIASFAQGSTRTSVKFGKMKTVSINLPSIAEQRHIVEILDRAKAVAACREQELQKLDELVKARFVEMFGNDIEFLNSAQHKVGDICESRVGIVIQPTQYYIDDTENGVRAFRSLNVKPFYINDSDWVYFSEDDNSSLVRTQVHANDVAVVRSGANLGDSCVITDEYEGCNAIDILLLTCTNEVLPIYLAAFINYPVGKNQIINVQRGGAIKHLNLKQLEESKIYVPSMELQKQYEDFVKQVDKSKVVVQKALDEAQLLFDSLMQEYFG